MTISNSPKRLGRPKKVIQWPDNPFTVSDLKGKGLCRVTVQAKVLEALEAGILKPVGTNKQANKMGRPSTVYQKS